MKIVLKKDVDGLGSAMDVLNVKDGYARNFLLPSGLAVCATDGTLKTVAETRKINEKKEEKRQRVARQRAKEIEKIPCTLAVKVGEEDKIFGSVTAHEIAEFLGRQGMDVDKRAVELEEPIRQLGVYTVNVKLYKDVSAKLKVWVVNEDKDGAKEAQ